MQEKVNVFMPCYNSEKYIGQAIESILGQKYTDFKLIIIDDGSTDNSVEIINKYAAEDTRIRLLKNGVNRGIVFTRNRGLEECQCDYMALMDSDDVAAPERLEKEVAFLDEHKDVIAVGGLYQLMDESGKLRPEKLKLTESDEEIRARMLFANVIANGTVLLRKEKIDQANIRYREHLHASEDYLFWCEVLNVGKICNIGEIFQYYRLHENSLEYRSERAEKGYKKQGILDIKKYILHQQDYHLEKTEEELFVRILTDNEECENLSKEKRKILKTVLDKLREQVAGKNDKYKEIFNEELERYVIYTRSPFIRKVYYKWSLLK
jgi:glycosyltransferase involved in cell wall biosynthesis